MHHDFIPVCFRVWNPDCLLWWLLLTSLFATMISGAMMSQINSFMIDKDGSKISLIKLQGMADVQKLRLYFDQLTPTALKMVRRGLLMDYAFMPGLYLLMWSITVLCLRHCVMGAGWQCMLYYLCWAPLTIWLFDLSEGTLTLSILKDYEHKDMVIGKTKAVLMSVSSRLKWALGIAWLLCMVGLLLGFIVTLI